MNKKAATMFLIYLIIGLFILLVAIAFGSTIYKTVVGSLSQCPGVCKASCDTGELEKYPKCRKDGEFVKGTVCCATSDDILNGGDKGNTGSGAGSDNSKAIIEIRKGLLGSPINHNSWEIIDTGKTYEFHVWGEGENASTCSVVILDPSAGVKTTKEGMTASIDKSSCKGENNKRTISLSPTLNSLGSYSMDVRLFDKKGVRVAWSQVNIRVMKEIEPLPIDPQITICNQQTTQQTCEASEDCDWRGGQCVIKVPPI